MTMFSSWLRISRLQGLWCLTVLLVLALAPGVALSQVCSETLACKPQFKFPGLNGTVKINDCRTTSTGSPCAWADVTVEASNFLACRLATTGPIALCYYSGVPGGPNQTPGCVLSADKKTATCDCYKISENRPAGATYSYVDINAILNKKVYIDTVLACGRDGARCLNGKNVNVNQLMPEAPVCQAIRNRTLFPGAYVVSDYSPILSGSKGVTSYECPTSGSRNVYAGCMTAPCTATGRKDPSTGLPIVSCTCPTYNGPNQVGNPQISEGGYSCSPDPYVWSAAYAPPILPTKK